MILKQSRTKLDQALNNDRTTILVLSGDESSKAAEVHDFIEEFFWEPWHRWFLVTDLSILTAAEKTKWLTGDKVERYAVLGGKKPKKVAQKGPIADLLLLRNQTPSIQKIELAFAAGDSV